LASQSAVRQWLHQYLQLVLVDVLESSLLAFFSLILIGKFVQKWWELAIALGLGGVANALAQTSMNFTSTHSSTSDQRASVFGLKQASIPTISLIIALLSPILLRYGSWRLGFLLAAVFSLILNSI
jgi:Major Facilitator Superfamily